MPLQRPLLSGCLSFSALHSATLPAKSYWKPMASTVSLSSGKAKQLVTYICFYLCSVVSLFVLQYVHHFNVVALLCFVALSLLSCHRTKLGLALYVPCLSKLIRPCQSTADELKLMWSTPVTPVRVSQTHRRSTPSNTPSAAAPCLCTAFPLMRTCGPSRVRLFGQILCCMVIQHPWHWLPWHWHTWNR